MTILAYKSNYVEVGAVRKGLEDQEHAFAEAQYLLDSNNTSRVYLSTVGSRFFWIMAKDSSGNYHLRGGDKQRYLKHKPKHINISQQ